MRGKISLAGLLLGAGTALLAWLVVNHYSFAWLVIGVALGMVMGAVLMRPEQAAEGLRKGDRR